MVRGVLSLLLLLLAVSDLEDECPNQPEHKDGYMDYDGCPEPTPP